MKFTRIKGDDRPHNTIRLPLLGRIRLGLKVENKSGKSYPKETDYFVVPPEVATVYGDKPKSLPVMLPVENEEMFLRQFFACYGSSQKVKCIGNGEVCERRDDKSKTKEELPCPYPENCDYGKVNKCHARTIIQVVLPEINMGGVYQISTGSINSDIDIRSGIEMSKYLYRRICWVPMTIKREEKKIPDPTTGAMQNHWPVKLYPTATMDQVNIILQDTNRIISHQERIMLPEPENVNPELDPVDVIVDEEDIPEATGQPPEEVPPALISEAQRKRFYAIAKGSGKSDAEIKSFLQANIGSESTGDIQKGVYEYLCNKVGKAAEA